MTLIHRILDTLIYIEAIIILILPMVEVRGEYTGRLIAEHSRLKLSVLYKPAFASYGSIHHILEHNNKQ
jgi:hypothetical protein